MLCCCRDQLDITDDSTPKISDTEKEKVFSEAVTAHPSPAASPVTQQPANKTVASELQPSVVQATTKPAEKAPRIEETLSQTAAKSVEAATTKAAGRPPVVQETISQTAAKSVDTAPTPNPKVSVINVGASEVQKQVSAKADGVVASAVATKDNAVLAQIDSLSQAVEKSAAAGKLKGRESCSAFASQLSVLTSQVRAQAGNMSEAALQSAVARLESVASRLENLALKSGTSAAGGDSGEVAPFVTAFDDVLSGSLAKFLSLSAAIGGDVKTQADLVDGAFKAEREFLANASRSKQPSTDALGKIVTPVAQKLSAAQEFRENNRRSEFFNHLSAISESIAALGWITVTPAPCPFVKEMKDAGMFYTNRVLKDFKEKDQTHVDWVKAWLGTLTELQDYVKQFHTTGVTWNPKGGDATAAAGSAPPPPAGGAPPPPPPGPPPPPPPAAVTISSGGDDSRAALMAAISKGEGVTSGLKKVPDDMKTHKNPALRQGPAPFKAAAPKPVTAPKPGAAAPKAAAKPPLIELQNKKWVVEYHDNNRNIVLDQTDLKQTVYVYKCTNSTIQVKNKVNSITLDSCKKVAIVFEDLVSALEFVNCQSMQGQVTGKVPTISIDKTDGCMIYLSEKSLDTEIVSAKSSEMNILVPVGGGDYKEFALPEQFKTTWNGKSMVTVQMDSI